VGRISLGCDDDATGAKPSHGVEPPLARLLRKRGRVRGWIKVKNQTENRRAY